jgi:hypothetical protein
MTELAAISGESTMKRAAQLVLLGVMSSLPYAAPLSQGAEDDEGVRCISLTRIDRTEVIDNRHIAFHMLGGDIYLNRLRRECTNLDRNRGFSYHSSTGQICAIDSISVIEDFGSDLSRGAACTLGLFLPTDEESLALLKGDEESVEVTVEEVEVEE